MFQNKLDFKQTFERRLSEKYGRTVADSHITERYDILGEMVRDYAGYNWRNCRENILANGDRQLIYFSMEFLMGRLLLNNMIPVIERSSGRYCYSLREGDVLWFLKDHHLPWNQTEKEKIASIPLSRDIVAVKVSASLEDLQPLIISQNYVPVTDDNGIFIGIVTRKAVMNALLKKD
jgi:Glucan phosphorylase